MTDDLLQRIRAARSKPSLLERIRASRSSDSRANEDVEGPFAIMRPSRPASAPNIGDALVAMQPEKVAEFAGEAGSLVEKSGFQLGRSALNTIPEAAASLVELPAKGAKAFLQAAEPGMRRLGIVRTRCRPLPTSRLSRNTVRWARRTPPRRSVARRLPDCRHGGRNR